MSPGGDRRRRRGQRFSVDSWKSSEKNEEGGDCPWDEESVSRFLALFINSLICSVYLLKIFISISIRSHQDT